MSQELEPVPLTSEQADQYIQRYVGVKSPRQIADRLGIDPKDVLRRSRELLDEIDVLTVQQKRQQLIIRLNSIANDAEAASKSASDEFKAGLLNAAVNAYDRVLRQLAQQDEADSSAVEALNRLRVRELLDLMREVVEHSVVAVVREYGLEEHEDDIFAVFNRHLQLAADRRDELAEGELE